MIFENSVWSQLWRYEDDFISIFKPFLVIKSYASHSSLGLSKTSIADATMNSANTPLRALPNNSEVDHCQKERTFIGSFFSSKINGSWPVFFDDSSAPKIAILLFRILKVIVSMYQ